ncbi:MAG: OmpA family protein [Flavobacteriales bacterium]|nr:OmpA family protein [Flavobacteriales bacterium]MCB9168701.1 OmpA family protein [Flavobacteriales bacterium]
MGPITEISGRIRVRSVRCQRIGLAIAIASLAFASPSAGQTSERSLKDWIDDMEVSGPSVPPPTITGETASNELITLRRLHFATGSHTLTSDQKVYLDSIAGHLLRIPSVDVSVQGHTDNIGNSISNQQLSQRRANSVRDHLIAQGFPAEKIESIGYGESRPLPEAAQNLTAEERQMNRRVELHLRTDLLTTADPGGADTGERSSRKSGNTEFEITTKDGRTIRSSFVMFSADGSDVIYQDPTDATVMKRLHTVDLDRVITPDGKPMRLAEVKQRLNTADSLRKEQERQLQERYDSTIARADAAYAGGRYDEARQLYILATALMPNDRHARDRIREIDARGGTVQAEPPAPAPVVTDEKKPTFFDESFLFIGIGVDPFAPKNSTGDLTVYNETGGNLHFGQKNNNPPLSFSARLGYEWEGRRTSKNIYFRLYYEYAALAGQLHRGAFGFGFAWNDRLRGGVDIYLGAGSQRLEPVTITSGSASVNGVTFGPGDVNATFSQRVFGVAPNVTYGFPIGSHLFARASAGATIPVNSPDEYSLKLKGAGVDGGTEKVRLLSKDLSVPDDLNPDTRKLVNHLGPFINIQFIIPL